VGGGFSEVWLAVVRVSRYPISLSELELVLILMVGDWGVTLPFVIRTITVPSD